MAGSAIFGTALAAIHLLFSLALHWPQGQLLETAPGSGWECCMECVLGRPEEVCVL